MSRVKDYLNNIDNDSDKVLKEFYEVLLEKLDPKEDKEWVAAGLKTWQEQAKKWPKNQRVILQLKQFEKFAKEVGIK